ncbi:MAG: SulP family inorganic anion transporter [Candidatus Methylomirabilia bacterium]
MDNRPAHDAPPGPRNQRTTRYVRRVLLSDLRGGVSAAVVGLPLSLAYGEASGVGPAGGLLASIVGSFAGAAAGGSALLLAGPINFGPIILSKITAQHGSEWIFLATLLSGIFLLLFGLLRFGNLIHYLPYPVTAGFTLGIGIAILLRQIVVVSQSTADTLLGFGMLAPLIVLTRFFPRVPWASSLLFLAILFAGLLRPPVAYVGAFTGGLPTVTLFPVSFQAIRFLVPDALTMAVLTAINSLLAAQLVAGLVPQHPAEGNRVLLGQGLSALFLSFLHAMPSQGAFARSIVSIKAGARSSTSAVIHGLVLLAILLYLGPMARFIPRAALAAILMHVSFLLIKPRELKMMLYAPKADLLVYVATAGCAAFFDLLLAVAIGLVLAATLFIQRSTHLMIGERPIEPELADEVSSEDLAFYTRAISVFRVEGPLFFGAAYHLVEAVEDHPATQILILRMKRIPFLDASGAETLRLIHRRLRADKRHLYLAEVRPEVFRVLENLGVPQEIGSELFFPDVRSALAAARAHLDRSSFHRHRLPTPHV